MYDEPPDNQAGNSNRVWMSLIAAIVAVTVIVLLVVRGPSLPQMLGGDEDTKLGFAVGEATRCQILLSEANSLKWMWSNEILRQSANANDVAARRMAFQHAIDEGYAKADAETKEDDLYCTKRGHRIIDPVTSTYQRLENAQH